MVLLNSPGISFDKKKQLILDPLPKCINILQCSISRDKSGISRKMYPKYDMFLSGSQRFLITGLKMNMMGSAHYIISLDQDASSKDSAGYLGKVRSDKSGKEYNFFDQGENPTAGFGMDRIRNQWGAVFYEETNAGGKGPRKINALIPSIQEDGSRYTWKPLKDNDHMIPKFKSGSKQNICLLYTSPSPRDQRGSRMPSSA
eukprot:TRINITY_DN2835_c0_g1_i1.p2 TRINITY_DN2835_c0_g1~~TRINITY_DN2835_c0_g1_i1.p2  ORF type:complete len:201 (-),score=44.93 TRINITY_DN2835_c0_g1_i1:16-618(-)